MTDPSILTSRSVHRWLAIENMGTNMASRAMLYEAQLQLAAILLEIEQAHPDHNIDKGRLLLEIGVQYLMPDAETQA